MESQGIIAGNCKFRGPNVIFLAYFLVDFGPDFVLSGGEKIQMMWDLARHNIGCYLLWVYSEKNLKKR